MWLWTSRQGFEGDLAQELPDARRAGDGLVTSEARPADWPVFARAGFPIAAELPPEAPRLAEALAGALGGTRGPWLLQHWVPDTDATNPLSARAGDLATATQAALAATHPAIDARRVARADEALRYGGALAQLCLAGAGRAFAGVIAAQDSPTLAAGGRARSPRGDSPSRAARKLNEAFEWFGRAPEAGEIVVDLGAAPGGWTSVLLARKARVIAVDPANLAAELRARKGVRHLQASAFDFIPDEPVDWLFCDMAWRPLEVAALLAKWGRRKLAHALIANIKLPMKQRLEFVQRVRKIVAEGGWRDLRARQLYHDREEITLTGWRA